MMITAFFKPAIFGLSICLIMICEVSCTSIPTIKETPTSSTDLKKVASLNINNLEKVGVIPIQDEVCPDGFQFVNEYEGWLFCNDKLWQTLDGGRSWQNIYVGNRTLDGLVDFYFINSQIGWSRSMSTIQKTEDGGHNWTQITSPINPDKGVIETIRFLEDGKRGWVTGGLYYPLVQGDPENEGLPRMYQNMGKAPRAIIFFTNDEGKSWSKHYVSPYFPSLIGDIYISNEDQVWALEGAGLYHLQGDKWKEIDFKKSDCENQQLLRTIGLHENHDDVSGITEIHFADSLHGWLAFSNGYIAKSTDGGKTWCDLLDPKDIQDKQDVPTYFKSIYFIGTEEGWGLSGGGNLYETKNGGRTWTKLDVNIKFTNMYFLDAQHGWVISKEGLFRIKPQQR